jgi:hypothetical protein
VGFPIRKSSDQRVFAPPRRLSQRITSFIACACQGIHQLPLRHLIVHIANIHRDPKAPTLLDLKRPASRDLSDGAVRQTNHGQEIERLLRRTILIDTRRPAEGKSPPCWPDSDDGTRTDLLFTMSYRTGAGHEVRRKAFFLANDHPSRHQVMVEPDGIEPTTPCLQSRCSPS